MNVEIKVNPLVGVWSADFIHSVNPCLSYFQFNDNGTFIYTVQHKNEIIDQLRGKYTYNDFVIIFEIEESEFSVTHSIYHITDGDKLYCKGDRLPYTENIHKKLDLSAI